MKDVDIFESILELIEKRLQLNRREFSKAAALLSSGLLFGAYGSFALNGCDRKPGWKSTSFPKVLLHNFQLFNGLQNGLQKDRIILIEAGRIRGIERNGDLGQYHGYKVIDLKGWTILPGLVDNHVHITSPFMTGGDVMSRIDQQIEFNFRNCVMSGVTTVRDVGGFPGKISKFRNKADNNEIPGPRVISSLSMIAAKKGGQLGWPLLYPYIKNPQIKEMIGGNFAERAETIGEIKEITEEMVKMGARWLKTVHHDHTLSFYPYHVPNYTDKGYDVILEIGEKHDIKCALHAMLIDGFQKGVELGFHTLEHIPMDDVIPEKVADQFIAQGMAVMPTMMIYHDFLIHQRLLELLEVHGKEYLIPEAAKQVSMIIGKLLALEKRNLSEEEQGRLIVDPRYFKKMFPNVLENLKRLNRMGAKIGIGTDCGTFRGLFGRYTDELRHMTSLGISNVDTLRMATVINADILDMQDKIGTIEKGKYADIIAVEGNPLKDIEVMERVAMVMKGGAFIKTKGVSGLNL